MIKVPLPHGRFALIDDEDAHLAELTWYVSRGRWGHDYAKTNIRQTSGPHKYRMAALHRMVLGVSGRAVKVDHINGDTLDCRRSNLRVVSTRTNNRNVVAAKSCNKSSAYLGVNTTRSGRWRARITTDRPVHIGTFDTAEDANIARLKYEMEHWGIEPRRRDAFRAAGLVSS